MYDALFIGIAAFAVHLYFTTGLGFYNDDWGFLASMHTAPDKTFLGLLKSLRGLSMRPVQWVSLATLYSLFGLYPFGYYLIHGFVLLVGCVLLYAVLRERREPRPLALATALTYAFLPHYSTARFWLASFQAGLSVTFYLLSLYAGLRSLRAHHPRHEAGLEIAEPAPRRGLGLGQGLGECLGLGLVFDGRRVGRVLNVDGPSGKRQRAHDERQKSGPITNEGGTACEPRPEASLNSAAPAGRPLRKQLRNQVSANDQVRDLELLKGLFAPVAQRITGDRFRPGLFEALRRRG